MRLLAIDPGTNICGYSLFVNEKPKKFGTIVSKNKSKTLRCEEIASRIYKKAQAFTPDKIICEYPIKSGPGWRSKNIVVLFHFCGMIHAIAILLDIPVEFIEVAQWKGQIQKDKHHKILIPKFKKKYGVDLSKVEGDVVDAMGIGDWYLSR